MTALEGNLAWLFASEPSTVWFSDPEAMDLPRPLTNKAWLLEENTLAARAIALECR